jgi:hypothetical protein
LCMPLAKRLIVAMHRVSILLEVDLFSQHSCQEWQSEKI